MFATWLLAMALAGAAPPIPYYDGLEGQLAVEGPVDVDALRQALATRLREVGVRRIRRLDAGGRASVVETSDLDGHEAFGALIVLSQQARGIESDMLIEVPGDGTYPVTVWWEADGLVLQKGPARKEGAVPTEADVQARHGIVLVADGKPFEGVLLRELDTALSLLSEAEHAQVEGLRFVRRDAPDPNSPLANGDGSLGAMYTLEGDGERIEVYDELLRPTRRFVGRPDAPRSEHAFVLLHEIGHKLSHLPEAAAVREYTAGLARLDALVTDIDARKKAYNERIRETGGRFSETGHAEMERERQALDALIAENNALVDRMGARQEALMKPSSSVRKVQALLGGVPAPTRYGRTSPAEAFADVFALFHADPEALERAAPAVYRWFAAGGHLEPVP